MTVSGIGGFFFRSNAPAELADWYDLHFGISKTPTSYQDDPWRQDEGPTIFAPFPSDTDHFGDLSRAWMINFRVEDLDYLVASLRDADIAVTVDPETYPNGRFAHLVDPEGNPIELWEPASSESHVT